LTPDLIKQLFDLRSQIPKEAANVICVLAKKNCNNMKKLSEILIAKGALLKVIQSATMVIAEQGHRAITSVLRYSNSKKIIQNIAEELNSNRNQKAMIKLAYYLMIIVDGFPKDVIRKK